MFILATIVTLIELGVLLFVIVQTKRDYKRIAELNNMRGITNELQNELTRLIFRVSLYKPRTRMLYVLIAITGAVAILFLVVELNAEPLDI